jgi:ribonucleoside-diphosphate reductase alpha chain
VLRVDHPDILEFIAVKLDGSRMQNFNLSVGVTDAFMAAVAANETYALRHPGDGREVRRLDARRVFDTISNAAWAIGDPGLVFLDRINAAQPTPELGLIEATNPCGEQPLLPFESCTLGSVNLATMVSGGQIDQDRLRAAIRDGVHFLDNVIDANAYPLPQIAAATRATRKIGLGVMGLADLLVELGVPYDSERALDIGAQIAELLTTESEAMSAELAEQRGVFEAYDRSTWAERGRPMRNATTTTVAPTGTISIIAGCSSGIEPLYALAYERNVLDGQTLVEVNPAFRDRAERAGVWSEALLASLSERGRARGTPGVPDDLAELFPTAHDVPVDIHVRMQAAFQRHVHAAVSKTINLPSDATPDDVAQAYQLAYDLGCKGVTIYRDGSRAGQVLAFGRARSGPAQPPAASCPECDAPVITGDACTVCPSCGWSVC